MRLLNLLLNVPPIYNLLLSKWKCDNILLTSLVDVEKENMKKSKTVHGNGKAGIMYIIKNY